MAVGAFALTTDYVLENRRAGRGFGFNLGGNARRPESG
jgi:hypothetical protein